MNGENDERKLIDSLSDAAHKPICRRDFIKLAGVGTVGLVIPQIVCLQMAEAAPDGQGADLAVPKGMVIGDPSRCTGCRRCEIACTSFNDGKNQTSLATAHQAGTEFELWPGGSASWLPSCPSPEASTVQVQI